VERQNEDSGDRVGWGVTEWDGFSRLRMKVKVEEEGE